MSHSVGWLEAAVLGIVQGLTEFLPISSSAHLRVVAELAGWQDPGAAFTAVTQIGTETAVLIYFRRDITRILLAWWRSLWHPTLRAESVDARVGWFVILGTLPIAGLGLLFEDQIDDTFRDLRLTACTLIAFGVILGIASRIGIERRELDSLSSKHGLIYGLAQALALIPGVSRSGGTISAGLLLGYTRQAATRYAFLLALPAVFASGFYKLTDIGESNDTEWGPTILATSIAFAMGFVVIAWLMRFISTRSYLPFVVYRVVLGAALLVLVFAGVLDAGTT